MKKVKLRYQKISDAKRFFEILNNPNYIYFSAKPKTIEEERKFLRANLQKRKNNLEYNYTILYGGQMVGGAGIKINQSRNYIGEIGYFVDEDFWGKGIATQVVKLLEKICFDELNLKRIEILPMPANKGSVRVAIKNNYKKEGLMKKVLKHLGKFEDAYLFAKVK